MIQCSCAFSFLSCITPPLHLTPHLHTHPIPPLPQVCHDLPPYLLALALHEPEVVAQQQAREHEAEGAQRELRADAGAGAEGEGGAGAFRTLALVEPSFWAEEVRVGTVGSEGGDDGADGRAGRDCDVVDEDGVGGGAGEAGEGEGGEAHGFGEDGV